MKTQNPYAERPNRGGESGEAGAAFGVVAQEMQGLSTKTASVADGMESSTSSIKDLVSIIGDNARGTRLADVALTQYRFG